MAESVKLSFVLRWLRNVSNESTKKIGTRNKVEFPCLQKNGTDVGRNLQTSTCEKYGYDFKKTYSDKVALPHFPDATSSMIGLAAA